MEDKRRLWVTGASGFLGRYVARCFADAGWSVAGVGRQTMDMDDLRRWGIETWVQASIEFDVLERLADQAAIPHCVFHAAGASSVGRSIEEPLEDFANTVVTTATLLNFLRRNAAGATIVLPSSAAVYGVSPAGPIFEDAQLRPVSPYGRHKRMAEELCSEAAEYYGLTVIVIRYFSLYGPGLRKQLLWDIVRKSLQGGTVELFGTGEETRDLLHVADAAELALRCVERTSGSGFSLVNGGSGEAVRVRDIAEHLVASMGQPVNIQFNGETRAGDPMHYQASTGRSAKIGFTPQRDFAEGFAEYAVWARQQLTGTTMLETGASRAAFKGA